MLFRYRSWKIGSANEFKFRKRRHHLLKPFNKLGDANSQIIFLKDCQQFERVAAVRLCDIFNHLSTPQLILKGLAAYISF